MQKLSSCPVLAGLCFSSGKLRLLHANSKYLSSQAEFNDARQSFKAIDHQSTAEKDDKWSGGVQVSAGGKNREATLEDEDDKSTDGGYAWVILVVMFLINSSTFGTARAYGLIYEHLARSDRSSRAAAALPFTIMGAVENMGGPLTSYLLSRYGSWRVLVFVGASLVSGAHLLAACFSSEMGQIITIGLMAGIGLSFITISSFQINNAYFVRYRGRALGLALTGAALGTLYISPVCQFVLDNYNIEQCYATLGIILFPNVPLALLLKVKSPPRGGVPPSVGGRPIQDLANSCSQNGSKTICPVNSLIASQPAVLADHQAAAMMESASKCCRYEAHQGGLTNDHDHHQQQVATFCGQLKAAKAVGSKGDPQDRTIWAGIRLLLRSPFFHLIWPTQLLFCWLNFVFGMILVDFAKDRRLSHDRIAQLIPVWAVGQLFGRMGLGSLVDLKLVSYKQMTIICFFVISSTTWILNNCDSVLDFQDGLLVTILVFILSMFIANLYILFNGLVVVYMEESLTALTIGISSFVGSFFLLPRASVLGHYRDNTGNYNQMLDMFVYVSMGAAFLWTVLPPIFQTLWPPICQTSQRHLHKAEPN